MRANTVVLLAVLLTGASASYMVGVGIADVTGPPAEVTFMGYAKMEQKGSGLHLRQFSRAFIFKDDSDNTLVFVSVDCAMMNSMVRREVLSSLQKDFGDLYSKDNLMISATHSHSTPGGFMTHLLFDISSLGFVRQTFNALVSGIVKSVRRAHDNLQPARLFVSEGEVLGININRSPSAYLANPADERSRYEYDVDKTLVQLRIVAPDGRPLGAINWYAVHPTSMNNTNTLVSSDNVGYAAILMEKAFNGAASPGKGPFVAAFSSSNLGDVSPNTAGPRCQNTGRSCDPLTSGCQRTPDGKQEYCYSPGPGKDMFDSTRIIAFGLADKAKELWRQGGGRELAGGVASAHQWVDMPTMTAEYTDPERGLTTKVRGCTPAMGYSFAAGTTDGPGAFSFVQGTTTTNPLWNTVRDFLARAADDDIACHAPKPILLNTGKMTFPYEWQPRVVSTQLGLVGELALACVPGEFTTMSGRRLRRAVSEVLGEGTIPVVVGLCNTYSDYIVTPEEYQVQRYEGASTIYGPHTLTLYLEQYRTLARSIREGRKLPTGPEPPSLLGNVVSLTPGVVYDMPPLRKGFGYVVKQPPATARPGDTVTAVFVSGHPRNNLQHGGSYLTVDRWDPDAEQWNVVATDADWETKFLWRRVSTPLGTSEVTVVWDVPPDTEPGEYRLRHTGHYKYILGGVYPYAGSTQSFRVSPHLPASLAQSPLVAITCMLENTVCLHSH